MSIPKTAFFVDGENLVCRYQAMLADGRKPRTGVIHVQDVFVWHPDITTTSIMNIVRVNYYTSMVGDDHTIEDMRRRIGTTNYEFWYERGMGHEEEIPKGNAAIVPVVFKKPAKSYKSRQVDIRIAIDMLRSAYNQGIDLLVLLSGDGDYLPLVEEVMRHDKETYVAAFSSGRAAALGWCSDEFLDLDPLFFEPVAHHAKSADAEPLRRKTAKARNSRSRR